LQGANGVFSACFRKLAWGNGHFLFPAIIDVYLLVVYLVKLFQALVVERYFGHGLAVKINDLIGGEYHRGAQFQQAVIAQGLDDKFCANAVQIADG
jgi:hypothetical protein